MGKINTIDALLSQEFIYPKKKKTKDEFSVTIERLKLINLNSITIPYQPISQIIKVSKQLK